MRIIWFNHRDIRHPLAGGAERTIHEIASRLVLSGHSVKWYSVSWKDAQARDVVSGIEIFRMPSNAIAHLEIPAVLRRENYDLVVDDLAHAAPWCSERFTKKPGTVCFRHLHRRSLPGQVRFPLRQALTFSEYLYPRIYRHWPFVTQSNSSITDLTNLGIDRSRIVQIGGGITEEFFRQFVKSPVPAMVYFGGMRDYKRPWECIYVFHEVLRSFPDAELTVVGTGPAINKVRRIALKLGIENRIRFTGKVPDQELATIARKAWVNVHSSTVEGFGASIIEASASGTPTVAYDVPGVSEVVERGINGVLVSDGDTKSMTEAVLEIMSSNIEEWALRSRDAARKYSWDETAGKWEDHLFRVLNRDFP